MAVNSSDIGFFSSNGTLKTESLKSSTQSTPSSSSSDISSSIASSTSADISEAVVVKISNQLNVGSTGYSDGVQELVKSALDAKKSSGNSSSTSQTIQYESIGGKYQNEILYGKKSPTPEVKIPDVTITDPPPTTPVPGTGQGKEEKEGSGSVDKARRRRDRDNGHERYGTRGRSKRD